MSRYPKGIIWLQDSQKWTNSETFHVSEKKEPASLKLYLNFKVAVKESLVGPYSKGSCPGALISFWASSQNLLRRETLQYNKSHIKSTTQKTQGKSPKCYLKT